MIRDGIPRKEAIGEFWNEFNESVRPCILGRHSISEEVTEEMRLCIEEFRDKDRTNFPEALASRAIACILRCDRITVRAD